MIRRITATSWPAESVSEDLARRANYPRIMSPSTTVAFVGILVAVLLFVLAAMVWQEAKRRRFDPGPTYVVEEAVSFIADRLDPDTRTRLRRVDIRRIVEWEVFYLQGLAQKNRKTPVETVAGGTDAAVDYIAGEILDRHGVSYSLDDIRSVLRIEAEYLMAIGAVGEVVEGNVGGDDR